jgi:hypothetical protein
VNDALVRCSKCEAAMPVARAAAAVWHLPVAAAVALLATAALVARRAAA